MARLLWVVCTAILALAYHSYAVTTGPPHEEKVSEVCLNKSNSGFEECMIETEKKWNITDPKLPWSRKRCCATWDLYDCQFAVIKVKCDSKDRAIAGRLLHVGIEELDKEHCSNYSYHSQECQIAG